MKYFRHKLKDLVKVGKIVTIHYFEFGKNFRSEGESHDFWEMVYAEKNPVVCTANGEDMTLCPGEIIFHKPDEFHALRASGGAAPNVFIVSFECRSEAMSFFAGKKMKVPRGAARLIYRILDEGKKTFDIPFSDPKTKKMEFSSDPPLGGEQMIGNLLEIFLIPLLRAEEDKAGDKPTFVRGEERAERPVKEAINVLCANIYGSLTIDDVCRATSYGKAYTMRVFKAATGKTVMEYYSDLKIEEAKRLLRETSSSVSEISSSLCFSEPNYFTKVFRKKSGLTPTAYRKRTEGL